MRGGWGKYDQAKRSLFSKHKNRGLQIPYELFLELTSSLCYYCGSEPSNLNKHRNGSSYLYNGLDRLDPTGGYVAENIVPCCWKCNKMKSRSTHDEFLSFIELILKRVRYAKVP